MSKCWALPMPNTAFEALVCWCRPCLHACNQKEAMQRETQLYIRPSQYSHTPRLIAAKIVHTQSMPAVHVSAGIAFLMQSRMCVPTSQALGLRHNLVLADAQHARHVALVLGRCLRGSNYKVLILLLQGTAKSSANT